jgi:ABC-type bacteriocin/lantibiotic exporter with double-glycine peptidase domain
VEIGWLNVPHLRQSEAGWCLPACVAMVAAYWRQPLTQADIAHWLGTRGVGTPASHIERLAQRGFEVFYRTGSLAELEVWLGQDTPCILFLRTRELPYWEVDTPHAVVLVGLEADQAYLLDPAVDTAPIEVSSGDLLLAWSYFEYTYAVVTPSR